jgi:hypothetical protein
MKYLTIKEIIPFSDKNGAVTFVQTRLHIVLKEEGIFTFPYRVHDEQWSQLAFVSDNEKENAIKYYALASYFIFNLITWTDTFVQVEHTRYDLIDEKHSPDELITSHAETFQIATEEQSETITIKAVPQTHIFEFSPIEAPVEYFNLGKRFFEKARFTEYNHALERNITRSLGATFEFSLSNFIPQ